MDLSKSQFDLLTYLEAQVEQPKKTQRALSQATGLSVGTINKTLVALEKNGLVMDSKITQAGITALEPYRVKRAIFFAAGIGERLLPITLNTPKPLVRVKGMRIIDSLLDAIATAGIEEVVIVRGYLSELFDQLLYKYPRIRFVENPVYNETNNISSAMCVRYQLANAYVMEADLLLRNPALITRYQYSSNYLAIPTEVTDDWCFETKNGIITRIELGGRNCHKLAGISYWNATDGARLAGHIKEVYDSPGGKERFWDMVALGYFQKEYKVSVRPCTEQDIVEIDTYRELKNLDNNYK